MTLDVTDDYLDGSTTLDADRMSLPSPSKRADNER
jgi:hypothetical protein